MELGEVAYEAYSAHLAAYGGTPLPYGGLSELEQAAWEAGAQAAANAPEPEPAAEEEAPVEEEPAPAEPPATTTP